jgi:hypothetical protein
MVGCKALLDVARTMQADVDVIVICGVVSGKWELVYTSVLVSPDMQTTYSYVVQYLIAYCAVCPSELSSALPPS